MSAQFCFRDDYVNEHGMSPYEYRMSEEFNMLAPVLDETEVLYAQEDVQRLAMFARELAERWMFTEEPIDYVPDEWTSDVRAWVKACGVKQGDIDLKYPLNQCFDARSFDGEFIPEMWLVAANVWGYVLESIFRPMLTRRLAALVAARA